jgi:hypothetical protein
MPSIDMQAFFITYNKKDILLIRWEIGRNSAIESQNGTILALQDLVYRYSIL